MAGTSVGGIIALGLAAEVRAADIQAAFESNGTTIFSDRPAPTGWTAAVRDIARSALRPKYRADALRKTIIELIGDEEMRIGDLKHRVIVPAVNLTKGQPQIFKTPHHQNFRTDLQLKVVDVALATAAAPTYFPVAEIGDSLFADGRLYANSPDLLAVHEGEHFFKRPVDQINLLSVGTTTSQFSFSHTQGRALGAVGWMRDQRLVNVIIASQQHSVDFMMNIALESDIFASMPCNRKSRSATSLSTLPRATRRRLSGGWPRQPCNLPSTTSASDRFYWPRPLSQFSIIQRSRQGFFMGSAAALFFSSNDTEKQTLHRRVTPSEEQFTEQQDRWNALADHLIADLRDRSGYAIRTWLQGSYKFGTQVRPVRKGEEFDIDRHGGLGRRRRYAPRRCR